MSKIFRYILVLTVFLLLFVEFYHKITAFTQDLGRHLITGKIIIETLNVPKTNFYSYAYPDFPFINTHWFSEVIFYTISQTIGLNGLLIFTTLAVLLAFSLIFIHSFKQHNNAAIIAITSVLYFRILLERTDLRPEIFSFLFLSIFLVILYSYRNKFTKWIFLLPIIELLWVNTHIYFFVGIIVIGLFLVDLIFDFIQRRGVAKVEGLPTARSRSVPALLERLRRALAGRKLLTGPRAKNLQILSLIFIFSLSLTLINPNGFDGAVYPLKVFQNYGYSIEENQNIFFLEQIIPKPTIPFLKISIILLFCSLIFSIKKTRLIDWLLSIFFSGFAIMAVRNFPLFVFATFIPFVRSLNNISIFIFTKIENKFKKNIPLIKNLTYLGLIIIIIQQIFYTSSLREFGFSIEKGAEKGADFYLENNLKGPIFNNFDIGSYLDYRFYGKEKVFIDGRPEAYPSDFFQKVYIPMQEDKKHFENISKKYNFNTIFFAHTDQTPWADSFIKQIINNKDWKIIYLDDYVIILAKNNQQNEELIKKYPVNKNQINLENYNNPISLYRLSMLFNKFTWKEQELSVYQQILNIKPEDCFALYNLVKNLNQENSDLINIYINRFNQNCK